MSIEARYKNFNPDDFWATWSLTCLNGKNALFEVSVWISSENIVHWWQINCIGVKKFSLNSTGDNAFFELDENHPVVRAFVDNEASLNCVAKEGDGPKLLVALLKIHKEEAGNFLDAFSYLNFGEDINTFKYGKIAEGPKFLIEKYADAISPLVEKCNIYGIRPQRDLDPTLSARSKFVDRPESICGICFGSSYVLCEAVEQVLIRA